MIDGSATLRWRLSSRYTVGAVPAMLLVLALTACEPAPGLPAVEDGTPLVLQPAEVHPLAPTDAIARVLDLETLADGQRLGAQFH